MSGYRMSPVLDDLDYLHEHGALAGVGEIIRARRQQIEQGHTTESDRREYADGRLLMIVTGAFAGCEIARKDGTTSPAEDEVNIAAAAALAAAEIDRLNAEFSPLQGS